MFYFLIQINYLYSVPLVLCTHIVMFSSNLGVRILECYLRKLASIYYKILYMVQRGRHDELARGPLKS
jgi:hypothetical protein